jgi:hypothetical protein
METLARILPSGDLGFNAVATTGGDQAYVVVSQAEDLGLSLTVNGKQIARLLVEYRCTLSDASKLLAVKKSIFKVILEGSRFPMFALDYVHDSRSDSPAAHWNVYANRSDVTRALRQAGSSRRGSRNRRFARKTAGVVGAMHFTVGGHRFRPCLEDVLDMLWSELGIDVRDTARDAIHEGRRSWRQVQLAAAVSDDPLTAAAELIRLGIPVDLKAIPAHLSSRDDRLTAF